MGTDGTFAYTCKFLAFLAGNLLCIMLLGLHLPRVQHDQGALGLLKLYPKFRGHQNLVTYFDEFVGPFFHKKSKIVNGTCIRYVTGFLESLIGFMLFACLWVDQLYMVFGEGAVNKAKTWCLCSCVAAHFLLGGQAVVHFTIDRRKVSFAGILTCINLAVLLLRLFASPPWWLPADDQWRVWVVCLLIPLPFLVMALLHNRCGKTKDEVAEYWVRSSQSA